MMIRKLIRRAGTRTLFALLVVSSMFVFVSCINDYNLTISDYDTALTLYNKSTDFASYKYFLLPDTVIHILPSGQRDDLSRQYDQLILQNIASNFGARGYVRISDTLAHKPDFVLATVAYSSTYVGYYYDWWSYWGWYYPYWPPGYGYYPPYSATYSYTTGTVVISMMDPKTSDIVNKQIVPVWFGHISGLLGDTYGSSQTRILNALNALFSQSPYLESGK